MAPDLSIVVVAYNSPQLLQQTLASIVGLTLRCHYELIVVNNASSDLGVADVVAAETRARSIVAERNRGFAAGNNLGIAQSVGRYVALVNPDVELRDDALCTLAAWLDAHPDVAAVGPALRRPDGGIQPYSFGSAPAPGYLARRVWSHLRGAYLHEWSGSEPRDAEWLAGTCLMLRRSALEHVGLLDERFFLYFEDVDLGLRLRSAGYRVVFWPGVEVLHHGGGSVGAAATRYYDQSLVRLYAKWYGRGWSMAAWLALRVYRRVQTYWLKRRDQRRSGG